MKVKKEVKFIFMLLLIIPVFSGCSGKGDTADRTEIDISSLGSELLEKAEFEDVKRNNISYNMSLPVWRAIFLHCPKKPYSAGFAAMQ